MWCLWLFYRARRGEREKMGAPVWEDRRWFLLKPPNPKFYHSNLKWLLLTRNISIHTFFKGRSGSERPTRSWWSRGELRASEVGRGQTWQAWLEKNQTLLISWGAFCINKSFVHSGEIGIQWREGSVYILLMFLQFAKTIRIRCMCTRVRWSWKCCMLSKLVHLFKQFVSTFLLRFHENFFFWVCSKKICSSGRGWSF